MEKSETIKEQLNKLPKEARIRAALKMVYRAKLKKIADYTDRPEPPKPKIIIEMPLVVKGTGYFQLPETT